MADYGLKVWNSAGQVTLDTTDTITRLRYSVEVAAGSSGSIVLSDIDGKLTSQFGIAVEFGKTSHRVARSGTTISWTARSGVYDWFSSKTLVLVFLYS